jgi:hypothetical protein
MKSFLSFLAVAILLLVGASVASAQGTSVPVVQAYQAPLFAPYVDTSIGGNFVNGGVNGLSTKNPDFQFGGGIESNTSRFLFDANVQYDTAHPEYFGVSVPGHTISVTGSAYVKLNHFLLGGGGFYSDEVGSYDGYNGYREQIRPFVGGGYQFKHDRVLVDYVLPVGTDNITVPVLGGRLEDLAQTNDRTFRFRNEIFLGNSGLKGHIRLTQALSLSSDNFANIGIPARQDSYTASAGIKFVF